MELPSSDPAVASLLLERARLVQAREAARLRPGSAGGRASGNPPANDRAGLERVANQFEALFYHQLIRSLRETVPDNSFWGQSSGTKIYQQIHDQTLADRLAEGGGLGIADLIVRQFAGSVDPELEASGPPPSRPALPHLAARHLPPAQAAPPGALPSSPAEVAPLATPAAPTAPVTPAGPDGEAAEPAAPTVPATPAATALATSDGRGVAAYRREALAGERLAGLSRLRERAESLGGAAADSFARWQDELAAAAEAADVDPALLLAVMVRESGGDPDAVSPAGARGLMQLMPGTAREVGVTDHGDPRQNLHGGARYLARMLRRFGGDLDLALAAYNAGPGAVDAAGRRIPAYPETQRYVRAVRQLAASLGAGSGTELDKD
ncbi:MAG TPA: transglycosylase SLT domain-containing protein [Candidatus Krumholzibacteria bacterium]|nr:transglycosylase SLT domain-containing protein [Candidatus Krumholzibacteria bacterium]HPD71657.1 transglycosylase SLT domain-containing protein [Candidatus Krumholzibacteria bacterium]HRY41410.1 transglycosylase SLT domain-containing protein [Candidatus Krumholzibacteria bacterium]